MRIELRPSDPTASRSGRRVHARWPRLRPWAVPAAILLAFAAGVVLRDRIAPHEISERLGFRTELVGVTRAVLTHPMTALGSVFGAPELPTLTIDMGAGEVRRVEAKRREALAVGVLVSSDDADMVPASIRVDGRTVRVRMRLKGDLPDHWDSDKWSYRVNVRDDDAIFGMRRFSLQHPKTRNYLAEWVWLNALRLDDVLAPRYEFVRVVFNGTDKGIYALEEHFSKELLESQRRREGVIVAFDESLFWDRFRTLGRSPADYDPLQPVLPHLFQWPVVTMREARVEADPVLRDQRDAAVDLIRGLQSGRLRTSDVFDVARLARFMAVSEVWEANHGLLTSNLRFYVDPLDLQLEPIGFDGNAQEVRTDGLYSFARSSLRPLLDDRELASRFVAELERVSAPAYRQRLHEALDAPFAAYERALFREFPREVAAGPLWARLEARQQEIVRLLDIPQPAIAESGAVAAGDRAGALRIEVRNTTALPLEILGVRNASGLLDAAGLVAAINGGRPPSGSPPLVLQPASLGRGPQADRAVLNVPAAWAGETGPAGLAVDVRLLGRQATTSVAVREVPPIRSSMPLPQWPSSAQALETHPFLGQGATSGQFVVSPGRWHVNGDLVLPRGAGLVISPGTVLRFDAGAILLASGPVHIRGSADEPVALEAADGTWGGVVVLDAAGPSTWSHVRIGGLAGISRPGWSLTGAVTFYRSPLELSHALVHDNSAEDAINVVGASFHFKDCRFRSTTSDAFDADFTTGVVERCDFRDIGGDAIDVSGSDVQITDVTVEHAGDKAVSVGEASRAEVSRLVARDVKIAIASKDRSDVRASQLTIAGARLAALAAYEKKREFGPGRIEARGVLLEATAVPALADPGSAVIIDGRDRPGSAADRQVLDAGGVFVN